MPEAVVPAAFALLLLAATSHRFRRDSGATRADHIRLCRAAAALLLAITWWICGAGLTGERLVRFVVTVSIAGAATVLLLSADAGTIFSPLRRLLTRAGRG